MDFKVNQKYRGKNVNNEDVTIQITETLQKYCKYKVLSGDMYGVSEFRRNSTFADSLELVPDRPHICEVLGVEEEQDFIFDKKHYIVTAGADREKRVYLNDGVGDHFDAYVVCDMINHPEKIIRTLQFSEDEKALMRLYVGAGFPWFARGKSGAIEAYEVEPDKEPARFIRNDWDDGHTKLLSKFLPQIMWENSPFNAKAYLEAQK